MARLKLATTWLGGCSGCHMSFLDLDEFLLELADRADVVFSPVMDTKEFPEGVDITLVEGAVANEDHLEHIRTVRERSRVVISFGDCAVTGNVTALRNPVGKAQPVLRRSYVELATVQPQIPSAEGILPRLLDQVWPVHQVVAVDYYLPGCPPPADRIRAALEAIVAGKPPELGRGSRRWWSNNSSLNWRKRWPRSGSWFSWMRGSAPRRQRWNYPGLSRSRRRARSDTLEIRRRCWP